MTIKPTNAYEHKRIYYIINVVNRLHAEVAATVAIPREVLYEGYITTFIIKYFLIYSYAFVDFLFISNGDRALYPKSKIKR